MASRSPPKWSLRRDLLFVAMIVMIVFINFASLHSRQLPLSTIDSAMEQRLELYRIKPAVAVENRRAQEKEQQRIRALGLLDFDFIHSHLLIEAPWAESHGSDHNLYLGAGLLYYSFAYAFQCHTIVVLGSGGGFVPRLLRQAQRDMERSRLDGQRTSSSSTFQLILIDAHMPSAGWGATFYAENEETVMRRDFPDIRYIFKTTDDAFEILKSEGVQIDYLHVDADHSFQQSYKDFTNYVSLLSPRGVVSFHDTCRDATRHCETGVPDALREIEMQPDKFGLQFLDAHYLISYRGIAFAIRKDAPALDQPKMDRWNFCQNNAASLVKASDGFDNNGQLSSLGAFYDCEKKYNITRLGKPCPTGFRRSQVKKDTCLKCIPGLNGEDCSTFRYKERRTNDLPYETDTDLQQRQRLIAAWLADHDIQHLFEINSIPASKRLYHPIQSAVAADPRMETPFWSDDGEVPILRFLPVRYKDLMKDGDYASTVDLEYTDAVVCVDCHRNIKETAELQRFLDEFPRLRVLILESHIKTNFLAEAKNLLKSGWDMDADVVLGSSRLERQYPQHLDIIRHIMLFLKKK